MFQQSSGQTLEQAVLKSPDRCSNFQQSNEWQKVQFNTDLFDQKQSYLYKKDGID